jgi:D-alanine-D-alanine ligase
MAGETKAMDDGAIRRVTVLLGGRSAEREVSLNTGAQVADALGSLGLDVTTVDTADPGFISAITASHPDVVFIALHGRFGEDGTIQGLLELLDIPYAGSGVLASALAMNKVMSKHIYAQEGLSTPAYRVIRRGEPWSAADLTSDLGPDTVVKPANEGSSVGMTIVHDPALLAEAVELAFRHDPLVLVERFEVGAEVTVGVLGNDDPVALPTLEIVPVNDFYDYESKYVPGMSRHIIPARVSDAARTECQRLAVEAHRALGCAGMSRSDTIVTPDGMVYLLETNTIPGMTKTSLLPDAAAAAGIGFPELCERLVRSGLEAWKARRG